MQSSLGHPAGPNIIVHDTDVPCSGMQVNSAVVWMVLLIESHHRSRVGQGVVPVRLAGAQFPPCEPSGITTTLKLEKPQQEAMMSIKRFYWTLCRGWV